MQCPLDARFLLLLAATVFAKSAPGHSVDGYFEPNLGQAPPQVQFLGRGAHGLTYFSSQETVLVLARGGKTEALRIQAVGAVAHYQADGDPLPGISAYFRGLDSTKWLKRVPHYERIRAPSAFPGIDLVYYWTENRELEYDFIVRPGVDPSSIQLRFSSRLSLDRQGSLVMQTKLGKLLQKRPQVYQLGGNGERIQVEASYHLDGESVARFVIAGYDASRELIIDPVFQFSTFLGSADNEGFGGLATDASGAVYLAGSAGTAEAPDHAFPNENPWTTGGGFHRGGGTDAFVSKLGWNRTLNRPVLLYSTFLGGSGADAALALAVTPNGVAYVTGRTSSRDFPLVKPIANSNKTTQDADVFVARLSLLSSGELDLAFSTRIGGSGDDQASALATDLAGAIYLGGTAGYTGDFPTINALSGGAGGTGSGGFVLKLIPTVDSYRLAYSTILGSEVRGLALSSDSSCHATGMARAGLPVVNSLQGSGNVLRGSSDAFAARLQFNATTNQLTLMFATYLGGTGDDSGNAIAFVEPGDIYVAGQASPGFPVLNPLVGNDSVRGSQAAFVTRLSWNSISNTLTMLASTLLTSGGSDNATALAAGLTGVYVTGSSRRGAVGSAAFPVVGPVFANGSGLVGDTDAFISYLRFDAGTATPQLRFSTLFGGNFTDLAGGIAVDATGGVFVGGLTYQGFPSLNPLMPYGGTVRGPTDVFLLRLVDSPSSTPRTLTIRNSGGGVVTGAGIRCVQTLCTVSATGPVILTATPQAESGFAAWSGACSGNGNCGLLLESDQTVIAQFGLLETLKLNVAGSGKGTVFGAGVSCGVVCTAQAPLGGTQTIRVLAAYTSEFTGWSGNVCSGSSLTCTFVMTTGAVVTAAFTQRTLTPAGLEFVPVTPCRIVDTRSSSLGPIPALGARSIAVVGIAACGIPAEAAAYSLNATVVPNSTLGFLTLWPTGSARPLTSTLNSIDGRVKANAAIVPAGSGGEVSAYVTDVSHLILDINGYFRYGGRTPANTFNPVTPCRIVDTRTAIGPLGGPSIGAQQTREFPVLASGCGISSGAKAYSLNVTAIPKGSLGYLTIWPGGSPTRPVVSTLNATTGTIVANAALVPASRSGSISVFATDDTDLVIDINGYFGGTATGTSGGLLFYPVPPCRIADTRAPVGPLGGPSISPLETRDFNPTGKCALPPQAKAYAANVTILPRSTLGYLTLWPTDTAQPLASTLNALDGAITANGAILPAAAVGSISLFSTDWIDLILDVSGFFAP